MPHRNKAVVFLVMPLAVFIWLIGWVMFYFGSRQEISSSRAIKQAELTFDILPLEQELLPRTQS